MTRQAPPAPERRTSRFGTPFEQGAVAFSVVMMTLVGVTLFTPEGRFRPERTGPIQYFVAPATPGTGFRPRDETLARWALEHWSAASRGKLEFRRTDGSALARIRIHWAPAAPGRAGEMRPSVVGGRPGVTILVRPDTDALGARLAEATRADGLLRDSVVYLTLLHEIGHALGLSHTDDFADVMYSFGHGGDQVQFFRRYRRKLTSLEDIAQTPGLSSSDIAHLRALYP